MISLPDAGKALSETSIPVESQASIMDVLTRLAHGENRDTTDD